MTMRIRDATPADRDIIVEYNRRLALETEDIVLDTGVLTAGVTRVLDDPTLGRYYLAEREGRVVGQLMTTYEWSDWRNGMLLWIQSVYVEAAHRNSGVLRALYEHVRAIGQGPGHAGVRLYVYRDNLEAQRVYARLGMVEPGYHVLEVPDALRG